MVYPLRKPGKSAPKDEGEKRDAYGDVVKESGLAEKKAGLSGKTLQMKVRMNHSASTVLSHWLWLLSSWSGRRRSSRCFFMCRAVKY